MFWRNSPATGFETVADVRRIERWLPIAEASVESTRERTLMTPFPAPNRLHVWWARRPLVASRAAMLVSCRQRMRIGAGLCVDC